MQGSEWYFTSNVTNGFGAKTTNFVALSSVPGAAITNTIAAPSSSSYFVGGITTQLFGEVRSPISFEVWAYRSGSALTLPCHPEIYYVYNGSTNQLGDWDAGDQNIAASTSPARYTWTVSFTDPTITGSVRIVGYLKSGTVSGSGTINILGGGVYDSHMDIAGAPAGQSATEVAANLAVHTNRTDNPHAVTAAQAGAVSTTDARYLATITNGGAASVSSITNSGGNIWSVGSYTTTNPAIDLTAYSSMSWIPSVSNITLYPTFTLPAASRASSAMLRFVNTNGCSVSWPTNITWYSSGTRTTNAPTLSVYNRIVAESFDGTLTLGVVSTNAASAP
jgi:hypothetical protein